MELSVAARMVSIRKPDGNAVPSGSYDRPLAHERPGLGGLYASTLEVPDGLRASVGSALDSLLYRLPLPELALLIPDQMLQFVTVTHWPLHKAGATTPLASTLHPAKPKLSGKNRRSIFRLSELPPRSLANIATSGRRRNCPVETFS
jgi:hypothetical protein